MVRIGIDLGGTNIAVGVVDEQAHICYQTSVPTRAERSPEEITRTMAECARQAVRDAGISEREVLGVGIGSPGIVDAESRTVVTANNLPFKEFAMGKCFRETWEAPVFMNNDANCAALGELYAGAAKGCDTAVMITLGTGIGGGVIIDGNIYGGHRNAGAELGHMVIVAGGEQCTCGRKGCFEAYASTTALIRQARAAAEKYPRSALGKLLAAGKKLNGRNIFACFDEGDAAAREVITQYVDYLAEGLVNLVNIFQPQVVLVGGGIAAQGEKLLAPVREIVNRTCYVAGVLEPPVLRAAELGNDAGIIGAAMLVK